MLIFAQPWAAPFRWPRSFLHEIFLLLIIWILIFILRYNMFGYKKRLNIKNVWRSSNWFKSERNQLNQAQSKQPWQGRRVHVSLIQLKGLPMSRFTVDIGVTTKTPQTLQIFLKPNELSTHFLFCLFWQTFCYSIHL